VDDGVSLGWREFQKERRFTEYDRFAFDELRARQEVKGKFC
jgi:hypothetical protein